MKIAFLNIYNGQVERGSEIFVDQMARQLATHHDVTVFQTGKPEKAPYRIIQISGVSHSQYFYHHKVLLFTFKCLPFLWKEKFDWIIPINGRAQVILTRIVRAFVGGKILISGHAGVGFDDRFNIQFGAPDVFIAITSRAFAWANHLHTRSSIEMIPNGVDTHLFNPSVPPVDIAFRQPIILCVSALSSYKRIELLIQAVSRMKKGNLLVIGEGPLVNDIKILGKRLLGENFQLISHVDHISLAKYYRAANVFSLPSKVSEAFGLVYVEAMACNVPVVAPDDINRRQIIGQAGMFCDVENSEVYAHTLEQAIEKDFGNLPRQQAETYSWEKIAEKYETVLNKN
jgi:glycosyltransferase involved in cell wall biosynthesis